MALATETVLAVIKDNQRNEKDTGSTEVQIALLTKKVEALTLHLSKNKKDFSARRGLLILVGQRRKLVRYLDKKDHATCNAVVKKLGIKR